MSNCTVGQALGTAAYSLEHDGKTYKASLLVQDGKTRYEDVLTARSLRMLASMRAIYTESEYEDERVALLDAIKVGDFSFHSALSAESLMSSSGMLSLAAIIFEIDETEAFRLMAERKEEVGVILNAVLAASLPAKKTAGAKDDDKKKAKSGRESFTSRRLPRG